MALFSIKTKAKLEMPFANWNSSRTPSPSDSAESISPPLNHFFNNNSLQLQQNEITYSKNSKHYLSRFICSTCGEIFRYRKSWLKHLEKHQSGFGCRLCAKVFPTSKQLESHRRQHWVPLQCTHCQLMFTSKHKLTVHHCTPTQPSTIMRTAIPCVANMVTSAGGGMPSMPTFQNCLYCGQLYFNNFNDHLVTCMAVPSSLQSLIRFERFYAPK